MASSVHVSIRGLKPLVQRLGNPALIDKMIRPGFAKAGVIVEGAAKENAHRVTGKMQGSIGNYLDGYGAGLEAHIGPQPGFGGPAAYSASDTSRWKTPRSGVNTGDPQEYSLFEEVGTRYHEPHPFLEPALDDNLSVIESVIADEAHL